VAAIAPGETAASRLVLDLPESFPSADPVPLAIALIGLDERRLELPHPGQTPEGWLPPGNLESTPTDASDAIRLLFDASRDPIAVAATLETDRDADGLHLSGTVQRDEPVFVASRDIFAARPDALYLASARYRASHIETVHGAFYHWLNGRGESDALTTFVAGPAYDGDGSWQGSVITHRPRPMDRRFQPMFLTKSMQAIDADIAEWILEKILFPPRQPLHLRFPCHDFPALPSSSTGRGRRAPRSHDPGFRRHGRARIRDTARPAGRSLGDPAVAGPRACSPGHRGARYGKPRILVSQ